MSYKWIGAILVICSCGGFGFSLAVTCKQQERLLQQLIKILQFMENELQYRLTPLPELCRQTGMMCHGKLREVFLNLARELNWQNMPDVFGCMCEAIRMSGELPYTIRRLLKELGQTLGRFDLPGQLKEFQMIRGDCEKELQILQKDKQIRLRNYQTLGFCAGAALIILLV